MDATTEQEKKTDRLEDISHKAFPIAREAQPPKQIEDYELSIDSSSVTLEQLVEANYRQYKKEDPECDTMKWYFPHLRRSFSEQHGGIERSYFARHTEAAAILTKEQELYVKMSTDIVDDAQLIATLSRLRGCSGTSWWRRGAGIEALVAWDGW
jgi:hypothetical protein